MSEQLVISSVTKYIVAVFAALGSIIVTIIGWVMNRQIKRIDGHSERIDDLEEKKLDTSVFDGSMKELRETITRHNDNVLSSNKETRDEIRVVHERIDRVLQHLVQEKR